MVMLVKPFLGGSLMLQDDHYRRVADLAFRHLAGAKERFTERRKHEWILGMPSDDPDYGGAAYLNSLSEYQFNSSEEYTQALAAVLFSHIWLLSAANYYRLSVKHNQSTGVSSQAKGPMKKTNTPQAIAKELNLPERVINCAKYLHSIRNTISHLVETDPQTVRIENLNFPLAYSMTKCVWVIHCAMMRRYGSPPDRSNWVIQTHRYGLPSGLEK